MVTRRRFLKGLAARAVWRCLWDQCRVPLLPGRIKRANLYLSVRGFADEAMGMKLAGFDRHGDILFEQSMPGRGHAIALHPMHREIAAFARRPGRFLQILDVQSGRVTHGLESVQNRHFYGHGTYTVRMAAISIVSKMTIWRNAASSAFGMWKKDISALGSFPPMGLVRMRSCSCRMGKPWLLRWAVS